MAEALKTIAAVGAAAAAAYIVDDYAVGIRRDLRTLNAGAFSTAFVEREIAAGRVSNVERFIIHAKAKPEAEYLVFQDVPGSGVDKIRRYTFRETDEESNRIAHYLLSIGVKPGDMLASLYQNCPEVGLGLTCEQSRPLISVMSFSLCFSFSELGNSAAPSPSRTTTNAGVPLPTRSRSRVPRSSSSSRNSRK